MTEGVETRIWAGKGKRTNYDKIKRTLLIYLTIETSFRINMKEINFLHDLTVQIIKVSYLILMCKNINSSKKISECTAI